MLTHPTNHIFAHTPDSLRQWCVEHRMPAFRAAQILEWVYRKNIIDPALMTNLNAADRALLSREMTFLSGDALAHQLATDGTQKLLIQWRNGSDGEPEWEPSPLPPPAGREGELAPSPLPPPAGREGEVERSHLPEGREGEVMALPIFGAAEVASDPARQTECVMIPTERRRTACISSQVGCPVGCRFCASGLGGLDANLSAGRIVEQVWRLAQLPEVGRISNVVFMGMGEPLSNFDNVKRAIETIAAPWGLNISARKITVSTVGLPKYIDRLARELDLPITLALSLHAPTDDIRRSLIPWSEFTTIKELLESCARWFEKTGREITLEYTLMRGVNDQPDHARELARLARSMRSNVNLIRYNEVGGLEFKRPRDEDVLEFQKILVEAGVNAHIRASRGRDIAAACGQLRHEAAGAKV